MLDYSNSADADIGSEIAQRDLTLRLSNRIQCDGWDGNTRKCKYCGKEIEPQRLRLLNAIDCKRCAFDRIRH